MSRVPLLTTRPIALALALLLAQASALAWTPRAQLSGDAFASAYQPQPYQDLTQHPSFYFDTGDFGPIDPALTQVHSRAADVQLGNGAQMHAAVESAMGLLRARASAEYPYLAQTYGRGVATASATFADTLRVDGAGLALGTPVNYRLDLHISGRVLGQLGTTAPFSNTYADATALLRLADLSSGQQVSFEWRSRDQATGLYSITLNTAVGHELRLTGNLGVSAWADSAVAGRSASADFMNTAVFQLAPSVAGLNTVGVSGHDFSAAPVPEPASWALMLAGGLGVLAWQRRQAGRTRGAP